MSKCVISALKRTSLILVLLCALIAFSGISSGNAQASTLDVCPSGCSYTSIQAALNAASPYDVIAVGPGIYTENLTINKEGIQLVGADPLTVIIQGTGGYAIDVTSDHVKLSHFTLQGIPTTTYGIKASGLDDIIIEYVNVNGTYNTGVDLNGVNTGLVDHVSSTNAVRGVGLAVTDSNNIVLSNITTSGNAWGGIALYTYGRWYPGGSDNIVLGGLNQLGEPNPLYIEVGNYTTPATPYPVTNFIQTDFGYTVKNPVSLPNYKFYQRTLDDASAYIAVLTASDPAALRNVVLRSTSTNDLLVQDGMSIQTAIDAANPGDNVLVYPGTYHETASNRRLFNNSGPYQFGLFFANTKTGISVLGVRADGTLINAAEEVLATVYTNATNNFGYSGIFVEADQVTVQGLRIGPNAGGDNKTFEVVGDAFTLRDCELAIPDGGSVYFNDWRFDNSSNTSHVQSYILEENRFLNGTSIDLTSGAGFSGPVSGRVIRGNTFDLSGAYWAVISFNGSGTGVPWFVQSVGGAIIENNTFTGGDQYIRARGDYDNSQFDWAGYFTNNTFERAAIVGINPPADLRAYSYVSGSYTFNNVRRIGGTIQGEINNAMDGDTVLAKAGLYEENININKRVAILGAGSGDDPATNTVIAKGINTRIIQLNASGLSDAEPVLLKDLKISTDGVYGLEVSEVLVSYIRIENVRVIGTNPADDYESEVGFKVSTHGSIDHLTIIDSAFDHLSYGWYFAKHSDWGPGGSNVTNVTVNNTSFSFNDAKGLYVEKLSNAEFNNCVVTDNGLDTGFYNAVWNGGFDINLKGLETYQNLTFNNMLFLRNGLGVRDGAGLMIKARDDGATYGLYPAVLTGVTINGGVFEDNERGIRLGEPGKNNLTPTNVTIHGAIIQGNVKTYAGSDGSAYGNLVNHTLAEADAENNFWGGISWAGYDGQPGFTTTIFGLADWEPWANATLDTQFEKPIMVYVEDENLGKTEGETGLNGGIYGYNAFTTIHDSISNLGASGTIEVGNGVYSEDVVLPQTKHNLNLVGAGAGETILEGVAGDQNYTLTLLSPNSTVDGLSITKSEESENSIGVSWSYLANGSMLKHCVVEDHLTGIYLSSGIDGAEISENRITGNANGILIEQDLDNVLIQNNEIAGNNLLDDYWVGRENAAIRVLPTFNGTGNLIKYNAITGSLAGVDNHSANELGAELNWWGSATGPANAANPGGSGTSASGSVTFIPWLCDGTDTEAAIGFQPDLEADTCTNLPTKLVFVQQPTFAYTGEEFDIQPLVRAEDEDGNLAVNFDRYVFISISTNPAGGTLMTELVTRAAGGYAVFSDLSIDKAGTGYRLAAASGALTPAIGDLFNVVDPNANLGIEIDAPAGPIYVGEPIQYTVTVSNAGPKVPDLTTVTIELPVGAIFDTAEGTGWTCAQSAGIVTCTYANLPVGTAPVITVTTQSPAEAGSITAIAEVGSSLLDLVEENNEASASTTLIPIPPSADLTVELDATSGPLFVGEQITYEALVTNLGPDSPALVTMVLEIPAGASYLSASGTGWACSHASGEVSCSMSNLALGTAPAVTILVGTSDDPGTLTATVSVTSSLPDPALDNNQDSAETVLVSLPPSADMSIEVEADAGPINAGEEIVYTITANNAGPDNPTSVSVQFEIPDGAALVSASGTDWSCTPDTGKVTCTRTSIPIGNLPVITIVLQAPAEQGTMVADVVVSGDIDDPDLTNNEASTSTEVVVIPDSADLLLTMAAPAGPVNAGGEISYELTVTNAGPNASGEVTLTLDIPAGATYVSGSGNGWTCVSGQNEVTCTRSTLAVGTAPVLTIVLESASQAGTMTVNAVVSGDLPDPDEDNNDSSASTLLVVLPPTGGPRIYLPVIGRIPE